MNSGVFGGGGSSCTRFKKSQRPTGRHSAACSYDHQLQPVYTIGALLTKGVLEVYSRVIQRRNSKD